MTADFYLSLHNLFKRSFRETSKRSLLAMRETLYFQERNISVNDGLLRLLNKKADSTKLLRYEPGTLKTFGDRAIVSDGAVMVHWHLKQV